MKERLKGVPLFAAMDEDDLERICEGVGEVRLTAGEVLFREGEEGESAYVIDEGEIEVLKDAGARQRLLAVRRPGDVIGEMALLEDTPRSATIRARTPAVLLEIPRATLDELVEASPHAAAALYRVVLARFQETQVALEHAERLAALARATAGLTHELNNPAAAVQRAASELRRVLYELDRMETELSNRAEGARLREQVKEVLATRRPEGLDALTRSDLEAAIEDWLEERGVPRAWEVAPSLVEVGVRDADLEKIGDAEGAALADAIGVLRARAEAVALIAEVEEASRRISEIVAAMKSQTAMDRAPVDNVDIAKAIASTLTLLKGKTRGMEVVTEFDPDLPRIEGYGRNLNDVWMNLIDNAADSIQEKGVPGGRIVIRGYPKGEGVVVEVSDNGTGIPPEIEDRIFEVFFTTKPQGAGGGVGLHTVYNVIVEEHGGEIAVDTKWGEGTTFRVQLPARLPLPPDATPPGGG